VHRLEDEKFRVTSLEDDVRSINEKLLLALVDGVIGAEARKLLQVSRPVARRLAEANASAIGTAIRCGVPLVTFAAAVNELLTADPKSWRMSSVHPVPLLLQELTDFTLMFARQLARSADTSARAYFGLTGTAAENLSRLALVHVQLMSRNFGVLLRLREGDRADMWADLFVGERAAGPTAIQIAQETILLSLRGTSHELRGRLNSDPGQVD
jgi:hypothetical protein